MKESVLDVLMYLFESFAEGEGDSEPNRNALRLELEEAGFDNREIERALDWLDGLNAGEAASGDAPRHTAMRIYEPGELDRLDTAARGYLLHLEQLGILAPAQRELAIDRLLALDTDEIDIEQIKWVVMMVLFSQPGHEQAFAQMEDLIFADGPGWIH